MCATLALGQFENFATGVSAAAVRREVVLTVLLLLLHSVHLVLHDRHLVLMPPILCF